MSLQPSKLDQIRYKTYKKIRILSDGIIDQTNIMRMVIVACRDIDKNFKKLSYDDKKQIIIGILLICIQDFGIESTIEQITMIVLSEMVDQAIKYGYHKISTSKHKQKASCIII